MVIMLTTKELLDTEQYLSLLGRKSLLTPHGEAILEHVRDELDSRIKHSFLSTYLGNMMAVLGGRRTKKRARRIKIAKPRKKAHKIRMPIK